VLTNGDELPPARSRVVPLFQGSSTPPVLLRQYPAIAKKPRATWKANRVRGWPVKKGRLVAEDGTVLAEKITLGQARQTLSEHVIRNADHRSDPLDYRLPGSYGSRQ
jgi:hypothetical protein